MKKEVWKTILQVIIAVLTAVGYLRSALPAACKLICLTIKKTI